MATSNMSPPLKITNETRPTGIEVDHISRIIEKITVVVIENKAINNLILIAENANPAIRLNIGDLG